MALTISAQDTAYEVQRCGRQRGIGPGSSTLLELVVNSG